MVNLLNANQGLVNFDPLFDPRCAYLAQWAIRALPIASPSITGTAFPTMRPIVRRWIGLPGSTNL